MAAATSGTAKVTLPQDTQILITREFEAPRHLVYQAYTTPELVSRWWPGRRGTMITCDIDLRVGGKWRYVMAAGDEGFEVAFNGEFREIVPNEKLVNTEAYEGVDAPPALSTALFEDAGDGRTLLTMIMDLESKEQRDAIIATGMEGGMQEGMDLLETIAIELA